eukprot:2563870-Amphidinium_carterae.1
MEHKQLVLTEPLRKKPFDPYAGLHERLLDEAVALAHVKLQKLVDDGKEVSDCLIVPLYG